MSKPSACIAIIGMACRFPGADDYRSFWRNLEQGVNSIREIPAKRWDIDEYYSPDMDVPNKSISKWCGLLDGVDRFDHRFFNISPREAGNMDPQQRLLLEETWHCIEDSGVLLKTLQRKKTSVYVGVMTGDYRQEWRAAGNETDSYACLGNVESILANRISFTFNLSGSSMAINAACASSLVAVHEAGRALLAGECDYAIAGGVNLNLHPWKYISFSKSRMLSPDGQCKTFDKDANGYVPGDGVGVILLQRLDGAVNQGNHIYGVIKGSAVNHCGKSLSITAPRVESQREVLLDAYSEAGFSPETVTYVEAHGTGTSLGDPIEVEALTQAFRKYTDKNQFCQIGSVKTNIGHLEAAAGVAGIIKVLLMMRHKKIPPTLNIKKQNPIINFVQTPFVVATGLTDWEDAGDGAPLRAGVSSFGFGGVNAHVLLEQFPAGKLVKESADNRFNLFVLSSKNADSLQNMLREWNLYTGGIEFQDLNIRDICLTLLAGREHFSYRCGVMVSDKEELKKALPGDLVLTAAEEEKKKPCLRIGDFLSPASRDVKRLISILPSLKGRFDLISDKMSHQHKAGSLSGFLKSLTPGEVSFWFPYALAATFIDLGFKPELVAGEGKGLWVSLAVSGIVHPEDVPAVIGGSIPPDAIQLSRPVIPFYDHVGRQVIQPYFFDTEYVAGLIKYVHSVNDETIITYVDKAKELFGSQFTFKKYLSEWDALLKKYGLSIERLLYDDKLITKKEKKFLFLLAVLVSLKRLNARWNLTDHRLDNKEGLNEMLDLLNDNVLPRDVAVKIFTGKITDLNHVAGILNSRQKLMDAGKPYPRIKNSGACLHELNEFGRWVEEAISVVDAVPELEKESLLLSLGKLNNLECPGTQVNMDGAGSFHRHFKATLLALWKQGVSIRWEKLYPHGTYRKVSLPGYAFKREAFWMPGGDQKKQPNIVQPGQFSSRAAPIPADFAYKAGLTGREFYLADHVVGGQKVLPGSACLEIATAAVKNKELKVGKLENIILIRPVIIEEYNKGTPALNVYVKLNQNGGGSDFELFTLDKGGGALLNAKGRIVYNSAAQTRVGEHIDMEEIRNRSNQAVNGADLYNRLKNAGYDYGPGFQTIQEMFINRDDALSRLMLPQMLKESFHQFMLHPSMLDGALQTAVGLAVNAESSASGPLVPFSIEEVEILQPLKTCGYAFAEKAGPGRFNITTADDSGLVCVRLKNLQLRGQQNAYREFFYIPFWRQESLPAREAPAHRPTGKSVVIVYSAQCLGLEKALADCCPNDLILNIKLGTDTKRHADGHWEINTEDVSALDRCVERLNSIDDIYFLGGIETENTSIGDLAALDRSQQTGALSLFRLVKALSRRGFAGQSLRLHVITNNVHRIARGEVPRPYAGSLLGLARSVAVEYPKWGIKSLDISFRGYNPSAEELQALAERIKSETMCLPGGEVAYRDEKRYIKTIAPITLPAVEPSVLKRRGVYLILGGAGGIGLELSRHLAEKAEAKLVLVGRSRLSAGQKESIAQIESKGGKVIYIQADATDIDGMRSVIATAKASFGRINGVFHSAIVLKDKAIINMDESDFIAAMNPKVKGSVVLHNVLRGEEIDFIMFFSSALSITGSAGQSNYVAACAFKDAYANYLDAVEPFSVKMINWGYWGSVGIVATEEYKKRMDALGYRSIIPSEGMEAVDRILGCGASQVIPVKADKSLLRSMGVDFRRRFVQYPGEIPSIMQRVLNEFKRPLGDESIIAGYERAFSELEAFGRRLLLHSFQSMGVFKSAGERHNKVELKEKLGIIDGYSRLYEAMLSILDRAGFIKANGFNILTTTKLEENNYVNLKATIKHKKNRIAVDYPQVSAHINLLWACAQAYLEVLTGGKNHMEVMFPKGSMSLVKNIYNGNAIADYYNSLVAGIINCYVQQRLVSGTADTLKILEVGAGTGGTSAFVLEAVKEYRSRIKYFYTDVSLGFTRYGEEAFGPEFPFVEFKVLNIENPPQEQGYDPGSVDIVFGSNVIHATRQINNTLSLVKMLLKQNGVFIVNEITSGQEFFTLTFGLTNGWWLFEDEESRMPGSPLLSPVKWEAALKSAGFGKINILGLPGQDQKMSQSVIVAESDGMVQIDNIDCTDGETPGGVENNVQPVECGVSGHIRNICAPKQGAEGNREKMTEYVKGVFSSVLKIDKAEIDHRSTFARYGVDSLIMMDINNKLGKDLGKLPVTLLFELKTIDEVVDYLIKNHKSSADRIMGVDHSGLIAAGAVVSQGADMRPGRLATAETEEKTGPDHPASAGRDIAIIGVSGRYPMSETLDEFWENLKSGRSCIRQVPGDRWNWRDYYSGTGESGENSFSKWGGFLNDVDKFDPLFFNISPREAELMDPQERLFLEIVWILLEDAGVTIKTMRESNYQVGVFVGAMNNNYARVGGNSEYWSIANRVSYHFDFRGPSLAVDTACSSSLTAIHLACESINKGECDAAIAGGVSLILHPFHYINLSKLNMISKGEKCRAFGDGADGFVDGEGVGAVLLKPLYKAVEDMDRVYAVIKGSYINSGGKTSAYRVPNPNAQSELIRKALLKSRINPASISYLEAQGTGSMLGDALEISGLTKAYGEFTSKKQFCSIGSVKSNIGHLESASGIAGITKILLQMKHRQIVPSIHTEKLNPNINFKETPFFVQRDLAEWNQPAIPENGVNKKVPRRAGISSFGAGGANAHIILEEHANTAPDNKLNHETYVFVLSARNEKALLYLAEKMKAFIELGASRLQTPADSLPQDCPEECSDEKMASLEDMAYTLQVGREALEERMALVASDMEELYDGLARYCRGNTGAENLYLDNVSNNKVGRLIDCEEGYTFIQAVVNKKNFKKIAQLWVSGADIDWKLLYQERVPNRVSLPTYPFERKRYWVSKEPREAHETKRRPGANTGGLTPGVKYQVLDKPDDIKGILDYVEKAVLSIIVNVLKVEMEDIDMEKPFSSYGVNSVSGVNIIRQVNETLGIALKTTALFDYSSVRELTGHIVDQHQPKIKFDQSTVNNYSAGGNGNYHLTLLKKLASGELKAGQVYGMLMEGHDE